MDPNTRHRKKNTGLWDEMLSQTMLLSSPCMLYLGLLFCSTFAQCWITAYSSFAHRWSGKVLNGSMTNNHPLTYTALLWIYWTGVLCNVSISLKGWNRHNYTIFISQKQKKNVFTDMVVEMNVFRSIRTFIIVVIISFSFLDVAVIRIKLVCYRHIWKSSILVDTFEAAIEVEGRDRSTWDDYSWCIKGFVLSYS